MLLWGKRSPKLQKNSAKKGISDFVSFPKQHVPQKAVNPNAVKSIRSAKASGVRGVPVQTSLRNFETKLSCSA